jgi:arsenate reductase
MIMKMKILFMCTHNSARSQMASGLCNHFFGNGWEAFSAGMEKTSVKPAALEAMRRIGIDISHHESKTIDVYKDTMFDFIITLCDTAREACPFVRGKKVVHHSFADPSDAGGEEVGIQAFCTTRDEIKDWLEEFLPAAEQH